MSSDTDFGVLLAFQRATSPLVILTREVSTLRPAVLAALIVANLASFTDALEKGAIVAIGREAIRVRQLPLR